MLKRFTTPKAPAASISFPDRAVTMLEIAKRRGSFVLKHYASTQVDSNLLAPSFDRANIVDEQAFARHLADTAQLAGLMRNRKWSASLPEQTVRTAIISLDGEIDDREQMQEVINWRIERVMGCGAEELRLSQQRLSKVNGQVRFLVTAARREVIEQYEKIFTAMGWQVGMIYPRHLAEAQWLSWDRTAGAKILVTGNDQWITVVILSNEEPLLVRSIECDPQGRADELFRVIQYYRDRLVGDKPTLVSSVMVVGESPSAQETRQIISEILNQQPEIIDASHTGLDFGGNQIAFNKMAAAAGLASSAYI
ncbi:MAG TPA: hypothetical protein VFC63_01690 [Blastocatellia bacterium]|nr:hypothetical protein [Blastocatellia bacterium]